jgi:hypothetical protein
MDNGFFTDAHVLYIICGLVAVALLRYTFRKSRPRKPATKRFAEIQAEARLRGNKARIEAEANTDKLFDDQDREEAKIC